MEIMKKLESHIPLQIKSHSDFSREYMKLLEEIFDIDYAMENKMFGNFGWIFRYCIWTVLGR